MNVSVGRLKGIYFFGNIYAFKWAWKNEGTMFTLTVIDSDRWIVSGIENYFLGGYIKVNSINEEHFDNALTIAAGSDAIISEIRGFGHDVQAFIELFQRLRQLSPSSRLIILTDIKEQAIINYVTLKVPNTVVLSKRAKITHFASRISEVLLLNSSRKNRGATLNSGYALTNREFALLRPLATKQSLTEIGLSLKLSAKTISHHKRNIMRKLNCKNCMELYKLLAVMGFGKSELRSVDSL